MQDCAAAVRYLAARKLADPARAIITGGSAGGFTTLACLTAPEESIRKVFRSGASHYGVSDLEALVRDTHKFESHYLDWLIGPYPKEKARYVELSPVHHASELAVPVAFFQGDEDKIVPPNQTERMVEALRRKGLPVLYLLFAGEQHGFRKADNIKRGTGCRASLLCRRSLPGRTEVLTGRHMSVEQTPAGASVAAGSIESRTREHANRFECRSHLLESEPSPIRSDADSGP